MTTTIVLKEKIRSQVLKVLSGYCFRERHSDYPRIYILSPWISDVEISIDEDVYNLDAIWFGLDYGIQSINLSYALLLLRLQFGAILNIVTLPPNERNYGNSAPLHHNLLDFLDEIGCRVYLNQDLHSKLILSNDSALIGSFNLTIPALHDREEIGVSVDDISNLKILEGYSEYGVITQSIPYGYTSNLHLQDVRATTLTSKITRGFLYQKIVEAQFKAIIPDFHCYDQFLKDDIGTKKWYLKDIVSELAPDLEGFYIKAVLTYLEAPHLTTEAKLHFLKTTFGYQGEYIINDIFAFLQTKLARPHVPRIPLRMVPMPQIPKDE